MALEAYRGTKLEQIFLGSDRRPGFRVVIWNPRQVTVQDVVLNRWAGLSYDISDFVDSVTVVHNQVFENNDDAVSSRADLTIAMETKRGLELGGGVTCPVSEAMFRDGTPIRIYEGDRRIQRDDWVPVFTGTIRGFPGADIAKRDSVRRIRVVAFDRAQAFAKQTLVGVTWPYDTDLGDMAVDVATEELGLDREEVRFGSFGHVTKHKANSLAQINKIVGLWEIMKTVGRKPYFDALGRLVTHDTSFDKAPVYTLRRSPTVGSVRRVQNLNSTVNSYEVIGLDSAMTQIVTPTTILNEVNVTIGYFDTHYRELIYYSQDDRRRAQNTFIYVAHDGGFGSGAEWLEIDEFHGKLTIDTGYAPWVLGSIIAVWAVLSLVEYAIDSAIDNLQAVEPVSAVAVAKLTTVRLAVQIAKAATMLALLVAMTKIGRYRIFIYGEPYEYVHQELRSVAVLKGVPVADAVERKETMHWLTDIDDVADRAKSGLRRELAKGHSYEIEMASNPILEVDDILEIQDPGNGIPDARSIYLTGIRRNYRRGEQPQMTLSGWFARSRSDI